MPWVYSVSSGTPPSYTFTSTNTLNQHCSKIAIPSTAAITQLKVFAAAYSSSVSTRIALWAVGGSALAQTSTFTMATGTESAGGQFWYTKDITPKLVSSGNYWVGLYRNPSGGHIFGTTSSGAADDGFRKTNTASFPSISSMSGYSTHSGREAYVGAFYITAPSAVTSAVVTRVSDSNHSLTWTRNSTSDQPYTNIIVERYDNVTGSYYTRATLSGSATSYSDTTTTSNRQYRYRIRAYNVVGYSSYAYTDYINTTPATPSSVIATRSGSTVVITWTDNARNETTQTIQRRTSSDGVTWTSYSTLSSTIAANIKTYTDSSPANYNQYQVRTNTTPPAMSSTYAVSNQVVIIQFPNPPSGLTPNNIVIDGTTSTMFSWTHNSKDSTSQTKISIRHRLYGASWPGTPQVNAYTTSLSSYTFAGGTFTNGNTYEYQIKTWGAATSGGPYSDGSSEWSSTASFDCVSKPVAVITDPTVSADYGFSLLSVTWSYTQAEGESQTQYIANVYDSGDFLLETRNLPSIVADGGNGLSIFGYSLSNSTTYKVGVLVSNESGQWSDETFVTFLTDFLVPPVPTFSIELNNLSAGINITIENPSPSVSEADTDYNRIYRSVDGKDFELIMDNIDTNTTVIDYTATIGGNNNYYIEAVSATPSIAVSTESNIDYFLTGYFILNSGNNYENFMILLGDVSYGNNFGRDTIVQRFEGREYPVKFQGTNFQEQIQLSCDLLKADYEKLKEIIEDEGNHFYRDHNGTHFKCAILSSNIKNKDNQAYTFNCTLERVDFYG